MAILLNIVKSYGATDVANGRADSLCHRRFIVGNCSRGKYNGPIV